MFLLGSLMTDAIHHANLANVFLVEVRIITRYGFDSRCRLNLVFNTVCGRNLRLGRSDCQSTVL
jgi:hypothetical protein